MSQQPEPPASIARALHQKSLSAMTQGREYVPAEELARAVWDALLAEGRIEDLPSWNRRVLVIPLPVVDPRDTEQQA